MNANDLRAVLLTLVAAKAGQPSLQSRSLLMQASQQLDLKSLDEEQALLTSWSDLFRSGYLAWGYDVGNPDAPFCHVTDRGRRVLTTLSRDPSNPAGYLNYLSQRAALSAVALSYLHEALDTYNSGSFKAAAVMTGAAAEAVVLELRDLSLERLIAANAPIPKGLDDWRIKSVLAAIEELLTSKKKLMPVKLFEAFDSYWPAFTQQIRAVRNEAGHPSSLDPIEESVVHAALLVFPELAQLAAGLRTWIESNV